MTAVTAADVERRLFEVLGAWAPEAPEPEVKVFLRVESFRHAAHAVSAGDDVAGLEAVAALLEEVAGGPADSVARLTGVYRVVVPALAALVLQPEHATGMQEGERLLANLSRLVADRIGDAESSETA